MRLKQFGLAQPSILGVAAGVLIAAGAIAQPANNDCANAVDVGPGIVSGSTVASTRDGSGSCGGSNNSPDVWYRYTATSPLQLTVETCTANPTYDTVLSLWSDCPGSGSELTCNDDSCGLQSRVSTNVIAGASILIRVAGYNNATGTFSLNVIEGDPIDPNDPGPGGGEGGDVVYSDIDGVSQFGPVGGVYAYTYGTYTCNIGTGNLRWGNSWQGSPSVGFNAYRLHNGRILQIGQSWCKTACCAAAGDGCSLGCNGVGGSMLGAGCRDVYGSGYNAGQGGLAKRSEINAFTGVHSGIRGAGSGALDGRMQVTAADLTTANFPGALYFAEGVYVGSDDAPSGNALNNASYRRLSVGGSGALAFGGSTQVGVPAIYAWRDHGLGVGVPDPSVTITNVDVPDEGRFIVGHKVRDLGNGTWRYDYAIFNLNSDRAGGALIIPIPAGTTVTNAGFHDINYHSGEVYDSTDWTIRITGDSVGWASPQTFAQNPNSNALRWGTMYNFWFDADRPPTSGNATLGLFKTFATPSVQFATSVPSAPPVPGDVDGDGDVDLTDLALMLGSFGCDTPPCVGDLDHDGDTDLSDLATLLANYGG